MVLMRPQMRNFVGRRKLFGRLRAVFGQDLRDGVREIEALAVRAETQRLDFADALQALLQQLIFEGHSSLLGEYVIIIHATP